MATPDAPPPDDELVAPDTYEGDADWLRKNFSGKTQAEAIRMFEQRSAANIAEDYLFMSHKGLAYYLPAALAYLKSETSAGDGDFVDWITTALGIRREYDALLPPDALLLIREIALYLKFNLQKFCGCGHPDHLPIEYERLEVMLEAE